MLDATSSISIGKIGKVVKATAKYDTAVKVGMNNRKVLQEIAIKGYKVSVDLERGGSGKINTHVLVNAKKYIFNEKTGAFLDSSGNRLPNSLQGNQQIIDAKKKADQLIKQGWGNSQ